MARTAITPQKATSAGLAPTTEAANVDGNSYPVKAGRLLRVTNGSAGPINVILVTPGMADGDLALPDRVGAVAAGATRYFGSLDAVYRQSDGSVHVNYSAVTTVTVAVIDG